MEKASCIQWLGLGMALGNRSLLTRLLAESSTCGFDPGPARDLFAAMGQGEQEVLAALARLGVVCRPDERVAEAALRLLAERSLREQIVSAGEAVRLGSALMAPEDFAALLERKLAELKQCLGEKAPGVVPFPQAKTGT